MTARGAAASVCTASVPGLEGAHLAGTGGLGGPGALLSLLQQLGTALGMRFSQLVSQLVHLDIQSIRCDKRYLKVVPMTVQIGKFQGFA